jgi:hypothetical protein
VPVKPEGKAPGYSATSKTEEYFGETITHKEVLEKMARLAVVKPSSAISLLDDISSMMQRNSYYIGNFSRQEYRNIINNEVVCVNAKAMYESMDEIVNYIMTHVQNCLKKGAGKYLSNMLNKLYQRIDSSHKCSIGSQTRRLI